MYNKKNDGTYYRATKVLVLLASGRIDTFRFLFILINVLKFEYVI